mgnify:CR=1 FL=1
MSKKRKSKHKADAEYTAKAASAAFGAYLGYETIGGIGITMLGGAFGIPALAVAATCGAAAFLFTDALLNDDDE